MTELKITFDPVRKTARATGAVAAGETVEVRVVNAADLLVEGTPRMRLLVGPRDAAVFPVNVQDEWDDVGDDLVCRLNLNTDVLRGLFQRLPQGASIDGLLMLELPEAEAPALVFQCTLRVGNWLPFPDDTPVSIATWRDDVANLRADIDGKAPFAHTHTKSDITDFLHSHTATDVTGLDAAIQAAVDAEAAARGVAVAAEATARENADRALQAAIDAEATGRGIAVAAEKTERVDADQNLDRKIDTEKASREVADATLSARIEEVNAKASSAYHYKGTVATVSDLPATGNAVGDVWNVSADGTNYAWTGSAWDALGPTVDLSGLVPKTTKVNGKPLSSDVTLTASDVGAASASDATLAARFGAWAFSGDTEEGVTYEARQDFDYDGELLWALYADDNLLSTGDSNSEATEEVFGYGDDQSITATRSALPGYVLGSQTEKPIPKLSDVPAVVAPSTSSADSGKAADAKATGDALAGKASSTDVTLTRRTFSAWEFTYDAGQAVTSFTSIDLKMDRSGWRPVLRNQISTMQGNALSLGLEWSAEDNALQVPIMAERLTVDAQWTLTYSYTGDEYYNVRLFFVENYGWCVEASMGEYSGDPKGDGNSTSLSWTGTDEQNPEWSGDFELTATRTALPGYVLGNQTAKPLAGLEDIPTAETWTFTVDDGQGGTTTVTKSVAVFAAQS